ncbi:predicted protein [Lichtheimia corymbifera JMRC:FSU:9682]|uniref:Centromere protein S n=1 Tax=Lichtheimia corymbifera JMRC:FSU:9682 TaxID=1263082 RepID=A0A068SGL7_9FUNG|nr:predicted protein [Lichtheimia corymbifera JMRC:FSU:9682]
MEHEAADEQLQLKAAIWRTVDQIARAEAEKMGKTVSQGFVSSLADIVYAQAVTMATDLEMFAKHGRRSTISMDDVKLCARRNDSLHELITEAAQKISRKK